MEEVKVHSFSEMLWKRSSSQFTRNKKAAIYIYLHHNMFLQISFHSHSWTSTGKLVLNSNWKLALSICDHKQTTIFYYFFFLQVSAISTTHNITTFANFLILIPEFLNQKRVEK